jgi:glycosyltransferase involved in cell wall biosynthesis
MLLKDSFILVNNLSKKSPTPSMISETTLFLVCKNVVFIKLLSDFGLPVDKRIVLLQGGLSAGRNLEVLVDAMHYVKDPSVVLVVLGDGLLLRSLQKMAQQEGLAGRVYFHAAVPQNELLELTAAADAGVIPYQATCLNNHYCTPNKLFEFIAAGLPILATDLPEIRRLVETLHLFYFSGAI